MMDRLKIQKLSHPSLMADYIYVVRDDIVPGGTKQRILMRKIRPGVEYVYATPAYGYAQIAVAHAAEANNAHATLFVAKRKTPHPRTLAAKKAGARIVQVPHGYLSNVQSKANAYCDATGATIIPFGVNAAWFIESLAALARSIEIRPSEVWSVAGSGTLTRSLQKAWPHASFNAVVVGASPQTGRAQVWKAPEEYHQDAKLNPPFPSCGNYDAKAWRFLCRHASTGALFWNVAA